MGDAQRKINKIVTAQIAKNEWVQMNGIDKDRGGEIRTVIGMHFFFFKQKTAYEIEVDWSSDVCSSDLSL